MHMDYGNLSKSEFINSVRNSTDPIYMKYSVDTNQSSKTITLPVKAEKQVEQNELSKLKTILQYQNSIKFRKDRKNASICRISY